MIELIDRVAKIAAHTGRTLEGVALPYERPSRVTDDGRSFYLEEFARGAAHKSIRDRSTFALGILHPWSPGARTSPIPIGSVTFAESDEQLDFAAVISRTAAGDEALELINDGALGDVSISARPMRTSRRSSTAGLVTRREEIALRELSLAPPGMGQHDGARVLVVRADPTDDSEQLDAATPRLDAARRRARLLVLP